MRNESKKEEAKSIAVAYLLGTDHLADKPQIGRVLAFQAVVEELISYYERVVESGLFVEQPRERTIELLAEIFHEEHRVSYEAPIKQIYDILVP